MVLSCSRNGLFVVSEAAGVSLVLRTASGDKEELTRQQAIRPLVGVGCSPALVLGTKKTFLKWIGSALEREQIWFPNNNGPVSWTIPKNFLLVAPSEPEAEGGPWPLDLAKQVAAAADKPIRKFRLQDYP